MDGDRFLGEMIDPPLKSMPIGNDQIGWYECEFRSIQEIPQYMTNLAAHFNVSARDIRAKTKEIKYLERPRRMSEIFPIQKEGEQ